MTGERKCDGVQNSPLMVYAHRCLSPLCLPMRGTFAPSSRKQQMVIALLANVLHLLAEGSENSATIDKGRYDEHPI